MNKFKFLIVFFVFQFCTYQFLSAGWPAWTNPAIPRSGNSEITALDQSAYTWKIGTDFSLSNNISGSHLAFYGLNELNEFVEVPTHRHDTEMDLRRVSLSFMKSIDEEWDVGLTIPYFWKSQENVPEILWKSAALRPHLPQDY